MITDHDREDMFPSFWNMNWGQRKVFVCSMVTYHSFARSAVSHGCSTLRRNLTVKYHFTVKGETIKVIVFIIYVLSYTCISVTAFVYAIYIYVILFTV